jgi:hypothetical protein
MKLIVSICALGLLLLGDGCSRPPHHVVERALGATNVVFRPPVGQPLTLSAGQRETLIRITRRFADSSQVRIEREGLAAYSGRFQFEDVWFGWIGSTLRLKDRATEKYYVIEDSTLARMTQAYFAALGPLPVRTLSDEDWRKILAVLESTE